MHFNFIISFAIASAFAYTASAQDVSGTDMITMDAPSISESEQAEPEWFRQFTITPPPATLDQNPALQSAPSEDLSFSLIDTGRWQFSVDLTSRPDDSPLPREEMSAGATFQITPRLSVGGDFSLGADELETDSPWQNEDVEAGIRLRSAFKF